MCKLTLAKHLCLNKAGFIYKKQYKTGNEEHKEPMYRCTDEPMKNRPYTYRYVRYYRTVINNFNLRMSYSILFKNNSSYFATNFFVYAVSRFKTNHAHLHTFKNNLLTSKHTSNSGREPFLPTAMTSVLSPSPAWLNAAICT